MIDRTKLNQFLMKKYEESTNRTETEENGTIAQGLVDLQSNGDRINTEVNNERETFDPRSP